MKVLGTHVLVHKCKIHLDTKIIVWLAESKHVSYNAKAVRVNFSSTQTIKYNQTIKKFRFISTQASKYMRCTFSSMRNDTAA
jgi:hypothetical protein